MNKRVSKVVVLVMLVLSLVLVVASSASARSKVSRTVSDVFWTWDNENPSGTSALIRGRWGVYAGYRPTGLTPGNAVTGWAIVFNQPQNCEPEPFDCGPDDMFHPDFPGQQGPAEGDFLLTRGHVIRPNGKGHLGGVIWVNDNSGSGLAEVICPDAEDGCTGGLTNPDGALIVLASHDHGPAQSDQTLKDQVSSFLGGCVGPFNGDDFGFAMSEDDIPDAPGECSTIQVSPHAPQ